MADARVRAPAARPAGGAARAEEAVCTYIQYNAINTDK